MKFYIYKHINPLTKEIFYVGKGHSERAFNRTTRTKQWKKYVSAIEKTGLTYTVEITNIFDKESEAFSAESRIINEILDSGKMLTNIQIGGKSVPLIMSEQEINIAIDPLANFIRTKRKNSGHTQVEFAKKIGVGLRFIREIEKGKKISFQLDTVNKVLNAFGAELGVVKKVLI